jgi:hypothetical protein
MVSPELRRSRAKNTPQDPRHRNQNSQKATEPESRPNGASPRLKVIWPWRRRMQSPQHSDNSAKEQNSHVWRWVGAVICGLLGALYGYSIMAQMHRSGPFGGLLAGCRVGAPLGATGGALIGFLLGRWLDHRRQGMQRWQFSLAQMHAFMLFVAVNLALFTQVFGPAWKDQLPTDMSEALYMIFLRGFGLRHIIGE